MSQAIGSLDQGWRCWRGEGLAESDLADPPPRSIRGGIPLCWPCFGPPPKEAPFAELKQHGFARTSVWALDSSASGDVEDGVKAVFSASLLSSSQQLLIPS